MTDITKQQLLLSYLISSQEIFVKVNTINQSAYWDVKLKPVVSFIQNYFHEYKSPPTVDQIYAETSEKIDFKEGITKSEIQYAENELELFCKQKAIEKAILASPQLLEEKKYGEIEKLIKDAITVGLQRNVGLDYFHDPEARLKYLSMMNNGVPTKFTKLDHFLGGGLNRKEMIIFAAPPGVGKSLTMGNLAKNLASQHLNGVYITLELAEEVVAKRFDSMFSGIAQTELLKNITKASIKIKDQKSKYGKIFIKRMPESSTNANHVRAYIKEFELVNGFLPDFICVDYLDLMCSVQSISAENTFVRDKFIAEELRSLANEFDCIMITASQLNRSALTLDNPNDVNQSNIAGGISKVNTADNMVAIMQSEQQKAQGQLRFKLLKTRSSNGVGNYFDLVLNQSTLCLEDVTDDIDTNRNARSLQNYVKNIKERENPKEDITETPKLDYNLPFQI